MWLDLKSDDSCALIAFDMDSSALVPTQLAYFDHMWQLQSTAAVLSVIKVHNQKLHYRIIYFVKKSRLFLNPRD